MHPNLHQNSAKTPNIYYLVLMQDQDLYMDHNIKTERLLVGTLTETRELRELT